MSFDIVVLNGGSSSGKSTISRRLQSVLADPWLVLSIDDLIAAMPPQTLDRGAISFGPAGIVTVGVSFRPLEAAWYSGVAAIAKSGVGVIVEDVFLSGAASQARVRIAFADLNVLWVGVHCEATVAAIRERTRADRTTGMATSQAMRVHEGVEYDLEVDTTHESPNQCAEEIAAHLVSSAA